MAIKKSTNNLSTKENKHENETKQQIFEESYYQKSAEERLASIKQKEEKLNFTYILFGIIGIIFGSVSKCSIFDKLYISSV